jgi:hypothetical protein
MMRGMAQLSGKQKGFTAVAEKCPCCPASACTVHSPTYKLETAVALNDRVVFHLALVPRPEARLQISLLRGHPKRGPPSPLA